MSNLPFKIINCYKCNENGKLYIGESLWHSDFRVIWIGNFTCEKCGAIMHVDGVKLPEDEARKISYENWGIWGLNIDIDSNNKIQLLKILKILKEKALLNQKDMKNIKNKIPGVVLEGTQMEMQRLKIFLEEIAVKVELIRIK